MASQDCSGVQLLRFLEMSITVACVDVRRSPTSWLKLLAVPARFWVRDSVMASKDLVSIHVNMFQSLRSRVMIIFPAILYWGWLCYNPCEHRCIGDII